jgi:hypothetical protein
MVSKGILVKANGVVCQAQITQDQEASEEAAEGQHLQKRQSNADKQFKWRAARKPENGCCAHEMPHGKGDLHVLQLGVFKDPIWA